MVLKELFQPPSDTQLVFEWDESPIEFGNNVSYRCASEDTYFEWDKEMEEYNVTCLEGGSFDAPDIWPVCVACKLSEIKTEL